MTDQPTSKPVQNNLADDLIWGAQQISEEIGKSLRQTTYLIGVGAIPTSRVGKRVVASRARLRAHFEALLSA